MLSAVPLPDQPLKMLWQSTVVDIEPGSKYGYRHDAAAINTTLAVLNDSGADLTFPLILATTDPEERVDHVAVRVADQTPSLESVEWEQEWEQLAGAIRQASAAQGQSEERIAAFLQALKSDVVRAYKSEAVTIPSGDQRFIRSYQRKLIAPGPEGVYEFRGLFPLPQFALVTGGSISVTVALPRATEKFGVDLIDWTRNYGPQAFGKDPGLPQVAGRFVVAWFWRNDPELFVRYRY